MQKIRAGIAHIVTLIMLVLLPWQTRYIFWSPKIGTSVSEFGVVSVYVTMFLAGIAGGAWLFARSEEDTVALAKRLGVLSLIAVCFVAIVVINGPSSTHAWILNVCSALVLGYATYHAAYQNRRAVFFALGAGLIPVLGLGVWQMLTGESGASTLLGLAVRSADRLGDAVLTIRDHRILRMYGSFPHPNILGTVIALLFALIVTEYSLFLRTHRTKILLGAAILFGVILACISRSAALAMACALCVAYGRAHQKKALVVVAFVVPILVWSVQFIAPNILALRGSTAIEQQSITERVTQVGEWWQVMKEYGIFGTGMYHYPGALASTQGSLLPAWAYQPIHNVFLLSIAEVGIVGCIAAGGGFLMVRRNYRLLLKESFYLPVLVALWSLAWFDHALWTSWSGMAYAAVAIALVFQGQESRISTLSQGVLDETK